MYLINPQLVLGLIQESESTKAFKSYMDKLFFSRLESIIELNFTQLGGNM